MRSPRRDRLLNLALYLWLIAPLPVLAAVSRLDLCIPHPFTSPDGGKTRCFDDEDCRGPPPGGWAWEAEDVGKFDASMPLPPFDAKRPQSYRSSDGGRTRCFIGYCCQGPPPGGWAWTRSGKPAPQQAAWYEKFLSWIGGIFAPATGEALQQALPDAVSAQQSVPVITASAQLISTALDTTEVSLGVAKFLQTVDQANKQEIDQTIAGLCPARNCSKDAISEAADELSNFSFMGAGNISKALSVSTMNPAQYQSYIRIIVTARAKQTGYTVQ